MTLRRFLPIGFLLLLLSPLHASAGKPLYDRIKGMTEQAIMRTDPDPKLVAYIKSILATDSADLKTEVIENILKAQSEGEAQSACAGQGDETLIDCMFLIERIRKIAEQETRIRTLGERLQSIATSYELPLSDLPGRTLQLSSDLRGILNMWIAGSGSLKKTGSAPQIRTVEADPALFRPLLSAVGDVLAGLDAEERTAAVWRYQYGVRLVREDREPPFPPPHIWPQNSPGSDLQYVSKKWRPLEQKLENIWDAVRTRQFTPPLTQGETAYYRFPPELFEDTLTGSIIVWVRVDGDSANKHPYGDVGLQWETPLAPVLPSLIKDGTTDELILGGTYPPEPVLQMQNGTVAPIDGRGLCTSPVNARGYLCRPYAVVKPGERCPVVPDAKPDLIQLVSCTNPTDGPQGVFCCNKNSRQCAPTATSTQCVQQGGSPSATAQGCAANGCTIPPENPVFCCMRNQNKMCTQTLNSFICSSQGGSPVPTEDACVPAGCNLPADTDQRYTQAGPDVCREIGWKEEQPFDPQTECRVGLQCSQNCSPGDNARSKTSLKDANGNISICINEQSETAATYLLTRELVHAHQLCTLPPGTDPYSNTTKEQKLAICCQRETESYRMQCEMMERDGLFMDANGNPLQTPDGVELNAETCTEMWVNNTCGTSKGYGACFTSRSYSDQAFNALVQAGRKNPKNVPYNCTPAIDPKTIDERVRQFREAAEARDDVCRPGEMNIYKNRIGNNACYIGQCVEQSTELHRLAPGALPGTVQNEIAAWDDPLTGSPLGNVLMNPPLSQARMPEYRPQALMLSIETALCQLQGLPPRTPPVLCAIEAGRQLAFPRTTGVQTAQGLHTQEEQTALSAEDLLSLSRGIGTRAGTEMYARYMRESSRSFADILTMAATLLKELEKINFPTDMCPIEK